MDETPPKQPSPKVNTTTEGKQPPKVNSHRRYNAGSIDETPPKQQNRDTTCRIVSGVNDKRYTPQALRPPMVESTTLQAKKQKQKAKKTKRRKRKNTQPERSDTADKKAPKRKPQKKKIAIFLHI